MKFTQERVEEGGGVTRHSFEVNVAGEKVPGVIWAPEGAKGPRPLVLMGHGGAQHKKTAGIASRARAYAGKFGYATVAIDAPDHGERVTPEQAAQFAAALDALVRGAPLPEGAPAPAAPNPARIAQVVAEWKATLDAVQTLDFVGKGPVGYWGVSLGAMLGVPFVAQEPRVTCAVFGLVGMVEPSDLSKAAAKITVPMQFVFQWDDKVAPRESGIALFNVFGSKEKTMHINPGGHTEIPDFERADWEAFYTRHLGVAAGVKREDARTAAR